MFNHNFSIFQSALGIILKVMYGELAVFAQAGHVSVIYPFLFSTGTWVHASKTDVLLLS